MGAETMRLDLGRLEANEAGIVVFIRGFLVFINPSKTSQPSRSTNQRPDENEKLGHPVPNQFSQGHREGNRMQSSPIQICHSQIENPLAQRGELSFSKEDQRIDGLKNFGDGVENSDESLIDAEES